MPNTSYTTSPIAGVALDTKSTDPLVRVGTVVPVLSDVPYLQGKFAMYIKANGAIGNSSYATVALTSISCLGTSVDAGATGTAYYRNGSVAFAADEYGWVYIIRTQAFQN